MVSSEDFSFPKIRNPIPHFATSPCLWRVTSLVYPEFSEDEEEEEEEVREPEKSITRKSVSCRFETDHHHQEKSRLSSGANEERMDMLWEDFNEEIRRVSSLDSRKLKHHLQAERSSSESSRNTRVKQQPQVSSVKTMKGSNNNDWRKKNQAKRASNFAVLVKVLKNIFMLGHKNTRLDR